MSKAARSVCAFSIYLMVMGALLILVPNLLLSVLSLPRTDEVWIHILGMLAFILGFYYFKAAQADLNVFFQWTVPGRLAGFMMFCLFGFGGFGPPVLILFGVVDGLAAIWTHRCLKAP
jgi:hypothetical protein